MTKDTFKTNMFAPCGMNCTVCYKHSSHKKPCSGCWADSGKKPKHCRACKIKTCAEKKLLYCFTCPDYPCRHIKPLEKSYRTRYGTSLMENSAYVKAHGLKEFMERQKEKYTCTACGGVISLHDLKCSKCGKK